MRKIILSICITIITSLLILANIPNGTSFTPATGGGTETTITSTSWSFSYGISTQYGFYLRDVLWNSPTYSPPGGLNRYIGMLSVPWVDINGLRYQLSVDPAPTALATNGWVTFPNDYQVGYTFTLPGQGPDMGTTFTVDINYHLEDAPAWSPGGGDSVISIDGDLTGPGTTSSTFNLGIRADIDIFGTTPVDPTDYAHIYRPPPTAGMWHLQPIEWTVPATPPVESTYGLKVLQEQLMAPNFGPEAGIVPFKTSSSGTNLDTFYLCLWKTGEELGCPSPALYCWGEMISPADIVIWDVTGFISSQPGPGFVHVELWMW